MKTRSIGFRLTLWYFAILLASLAIFTVTVWISMRRSIKHTVDHALRERLTGVSDFLAVQLHNGSYDEVEREFEEHARLSSSGDLLQIADTNGNWIYRADALRAYALPIARRPGGPMEFETASGARGRL